MAALLLQTIYGLSHHESGGTIELCKLIKGDTSSQQHSLLFQSNNYYQHPDLSQPIATHLWLSTIKQIVVRYHVPTIAPGPAKVRAQTGIPPVSPRRHAQQHRRLRVGRPRLRAPLDATLGLTLCRESLLHHPPPQEAQEGHAGPGNMRQRKDSS